MNRKQFIHIAGSAIVLLANGKILNASNLPGLPHENILFRFAIASDGHYGEENTNFQDHFSTIVQYINNDHAHHPFRFTVINGDIVHDDKSFYPAAKQALDALNCKYYVSQGNHDHVTHDEWKSIWGMPVNLDFTYKKCAFLVGTTSNETGEYLCPDIEWLREKLHQHRNKEVFIFIHINPGALTKHAVDCPRFFELLGHHKNIKAVFNGHDHDEDGIKVKNNIPFIFDSHFGGSWGTVYRGYRVVEVMNDGSVITYIMNPDHPINKEKINSYQTSFIN